MADQQSHSSGTNGSKSSRNWRGQRENGVAKAKHRWQDPTAGKQTASASAGSSGRLRLVAGIVCLLLLLAYFLNALLSAPTMTPMIVLSSIEYDDPLPINAWAKEDIESLRQLHQSSITLDEVSFDQPMSESWDQLTQSLKRATARNSESLIVYVTMHGAVDHRGVPCLIPSSASPRNSETWIPLRKLLDEMTSTPELKRRRKLLVLDCVKSLSEWDLGIAYNTFANRLTELCAGMSDEKLSVLVSCGPGEVAWTSPDLGGSAFGRFFRDGLSGLADLAANSGNGDRWVTLTELYHYVQQRTDEWAGHNRGISQKPLLLVEQDFQLASALRTFGVGPSRVGTESSSSNKTILSSGQIESHWNNYQQLSADGEFRRLCPSESTRLCRRLLRLECLNRGGGGYQLMTRRLNDEISLQLERINQGLADGSNWKRSLIHRLRAYQAMPLIPPRANIHDLHLAEYLGTVGSVTSTENRLGMIPAESYFAELLSRYNQSESNDHESKTRINFLLQRAGELATPSNPFQIGPGDERGHAWIRDRLTKADQSRRIAQDLLLAGVTPDQAQFTNSLQEAGSEYEHAALDWAMISRAYSLRDQMLAVLPYLLRWITNPLRNDGERGSPSSSEDATSKDMRWPQLLTQLDELAVELGRPPIGSEELTEQLARVRHLSERIASFEPSSETGLWNEFVARFHRECDELISCEATGEYARRIEVALSVPLIPAAKRTALGKQLEKVSAELREQVSATKATATDRTSSVDYVSWWNSLRTDPMLAWLDVGTERVADEAKDPSQPREETNSEESSVAASQTRMSEGHSKIEERGGTVRRRLSHWTDSPSTTASLDPSDLARSFNHDDLLDRAAIAFGMQLPADNAIVQRRRHDLQQLLLWHSDRTLRDFWGPAQPSGEPLFVSVSRDYVKAANEYSPVGDAEQRLANIAWHAHQAKRLATIRPLANSLKTSEHSDMRALLEVSGHDADHSGRIAATGYLTLLCRDDRKSSVRHLRVQAIDGDADLAAEQALTFPRTKITTVAVETTQPIDSPGRPLRIVGLFRGHEFSSDVSFREARGTQTNFSPPAEQPTRITVLGDHSNLSVMFVLDESQSMNETVGEDAKRTRLEVAKTALEKMLVRIGEIPGIRCGVLVYGSRVGWSPSDPDKLLFRSPAPESLAPNQDVDTILPLGRFDIAELATVSGKLANVGGWGQSPHYFALLLGLERLQTEDKLTSKVVIMITDGGRFAAEAKSAKEESVSWDELEQAVAASGAIVHFLQPSSGDAEDLAALKRIAGQSGGSVQESGLAEDLVTTVVNSAGSGSFTVRRRSNLSTADGPGPTHSTDVALDNTAEFGTDVVLPLPIGTRDQYTIQAGHATADIEVVAGQTVFLRYRPDHRDLIVPYFHREFAQSARLVYSSSLEPTGYLCLAHRPVANRGVVMFPVSIQHERQQFTPQPVGVLIEIAPHTSSGVPTGESYLFGDPSYLANAPVPMLECLAQKWPAKATHARLRVWCQPQAVAADHTVAVRDLVKVDEKVVGDLEEKTITNLAKDGRFTARLVMTVDLPDRFVIAINQEPSEESSDSDRCWITVHCTEVSPARVIRQFDPDGGMATHRFEFHLKDRQRVLDSGRLDFISIRKLREQGWTTADEPLIVSIPGGDDLLGQHE